MNLDATLDKPPLMRAGTGLEAAEYEALASQSQAQWSQRQAQRAVARQRRQRAPGAGRKGVLASERHKLLFIWFYFKVYPTQAPDNVHVLIADLL